MNSSNTPQFDRLVKRLLKLMPEPVPQPFRSGWYRWLHSDLGIGHLHSMPRSLAPRVNQLCGLDDEIRLLRANTRALLKGVGADNALLTGPRGCGKTSLMRGVLGEFVSKGLRVIVLTRGHLRDIPILINALHNHADEPVIIACDELSFAGTGVDHLEVKAALDDLEQLDNCLIYATSNRRRLIPENQEENLAAHVDADGQLHPEETTEEKISLADRFGLWLPVFAPNEENYLLMVASWLGQLSTRKANARIDKLAVQWAREHGSMNGRTARQFVRQLLQRPN